MQMSCCSWPPFKKEGGASRAHAPVSSPQQARDSEQRLICYCLILSGLRLRTCSFSVLFLTGLRTRSVFWEGIFISFRRGGDCNLALLHFQAAIGCFQQSGGTRCGPPFFPPVELICIVQTHTFRKVSLKFYQCIIHLQNHNQNTFGNVTNTLSPNMLEED